MKLSVLVENQNPEHPDLEAQHGLSLFIETSGKKIIMDFGVDDAYRRNADEMGIDLSEADYAILSHSHFDHGGGLRDYLLNSHDTPVHMSSMVGSGYAFKYLGIMKKQIGFEVDLDDADLTRTVDGELRVFMVEEDVKLSDHIWLLSNTHHDGFIPKGNQSLFKLVDDEWEFDDFRHELILAIEEPDGLVVVTGCSHGGIGNMVKTAVEKTGIKTVKAVVGGFHLMNPHSGLMVETEAEVRDLLDELEWIGVKSIVTGHCTGDEGYDVIARCWPGTLHAMHTGEVVYL